MSDVGYSLGPGIDSLPDDWTFQLALAYLTSAQSCGFDCERAFVADSGYVEPCCDPCQLAVIVDAGWTPDPRAGAAGICLPNLTVSVKLLLDQCVYVPEEDEGYDPVKENTQAQINLSARWQIMRGLQAGRAAGALTVACGRVVPAQWTNLWTEGGCARWQTVWTVSI